MKILITGAAGMLASAIISELEQSGSTIFGESIELLKGDIHLRVPDIFRIDVSNRE